MKKDSDLPFFATSFLFCFQVNCRERNVYSEDSEMISERTGFNALRPAALDSLRCPPFACLSRAFLSVSIIILSIIPDRFIGVDWLLSPFSLNDSTGVSNSV